MWVVLGSLLLAAVWIYLFHSVTRLLQASSPLDKPDADYFTRIDFDEIAMQTLEEERGNGR